MTITHTQKTDVANYIITKILDCNADSPLSLAVAAGIYHDGPAYLVCLSDADIDQLQYTLDGSPHPLEMHDRNALKVFQDFVRYKHSINESIPDTPDGWNAIERSYFVEYRCSGYYPFYSTTSPSFFT